MEHPDSEPVNPLATRESDAALTSSDLAAELATTRDRLAFYESFDSLVQENVRRSGELLRQVAAEREAVERRLHAMRAELDERLAEQRTMLAEIASGLGYMETHVGTVMSRVNESLARLSKSLSAAPHGNESLDSLMQQERDARTGGGDEAAGKSSSPDGMDELRSASGNAYSASDATVPVDVMPASSQAMPDDHETNGGAKPFDTVAGSAAVPVDAPALTGPRTIDLVIHGVPKAATALSIQRYLQNLAGVQTVEVREYVSGVLRIQVVATTLSPEDLRRWEGGGDLQTITAEQNVLELKLPSAEGF